jgi:LacI family transcriptional regulator, repressor for deo operon, udp, cdd, tsx, nupC, and nupG
VTTRLADIAAQAGVSEATVSRVLNGKPGVAATTRQSVLAALDVLGYERPVRLRQRSEGLVGLITPELENPIFPALAQVIGQALTR